jgi:trans-aconitate methyltransferase|tara:strand:- start:348 stop:1199 length:852 start_codon:yes stop_codon:yes gene_type:complete
MKFKTFYTLFYKHRIVKAPIYRKIYLLLVIPIRYFFNLFYLDKKINLDKMSIKKNFLFNQDLNYLFEFFNTDKGDRYINQYTQPSKKKSKKIKAHGYTKFYENIFYKIKNENINIMELGSFYGNASAALYFYFKNSKIYGGDINPDMFKYKSNRIKNFYINSSSQKSIKNEIINLDVSFKIIIEDASHMLKDQIISLFLLFQKLEPGGYFIVEELDFPETREDMRINQTFPDLKSILNSINKKEDFTSPYIDQRSKSYFLENFEYIKIFMGNMNELAIIKKKS